MKATLQRKLYLLEKNYVRFSFPRKDMADCFVSIVMSFVLFSEEYEQMSKLLKNMLWFVFNNVFAHFSAFWFYV